MVDIYDYEASTTSAYLLTSSKQPPMMPMMPMMPMIDHRS